MLASWWALRKILRFQGQSDPTFCIEKMACEGSAGSPETLRPRVRLTACTAEYCLDIDIDFGDSTEVRPKESWGVIAMFDDMRSADEGLGAQEDDERKFKINLDVVHLLGCAMCHSSG